MSLQLAAQHLSSQGRGKDSTLVHMSPREVKSLNELAMAHGGQLSINPNTGLPEAGFLESLLPAVAGFALNAAMPGSGMLVPALVGGGMALMTGSLEKGLMAGLGAYGGANLGASLAQTGVEAAAATAPEIAAAQANAATQMQNFYDPAAQAFKPGGLEAVQKASMDASTAYANAQTSAQAAYDKLGFMDKIKSNFGTLTSPGGASGLFDKISSSPMSLLKTVGSSAAPAISEAMKPKEQEETKADSDMGQRYGFSMNPTGGQQTQQPQQPQQPQQAQPGQNPLGNMQTPTTTPFPTPDIYGREQRYFSPSYTKFTPEQAKSAYGYADGGITGSGNLDLHIPLDLGGGSGGGGNDGGAYPFQSSGGFAGYNNAPQVAQQAQRLAQQASATQGLGASQGPLLAAPQGPLLAGGSMGQFPYAAGGARPEGLGSLFNAQKMADGGVATDPDRPTETPALLAFRQMQAQRAAQAQAPQVDAVAQYAEYLKQTMGTPNQMQAPTAPPPTTTSLASSGYAYNPMNQQYGQIQGTAPDDSDSDSDSNSPFKIGNRPVIGYTSTGEKIYGEGPSGGMFGKFDVGSNRGYATGGGISDAHYNLGGYSDGGRLLRGPGDGVSDSIPAVIGRKQPARLADGEFVVPARIVSELGNGSTEAGARKLYAMMDRIQKARGKTVGKGKVAKNSRSEKYLPA